MAEEEDEKQLTDDLGASPSSGVNPDDNKPEGTIDTCNDAKDDCSDLTDNNHETDELSSKTFPQKLMEILSDERNAHIISWLPHGTGFQIHKKKTFATEILPRKFKASKFTSFTRKLNRWGFTRVPRGPETGAYFHKLFRRDQPQLCSSMTSNSGNKYQSSPMQQQLLPNLPGMMPAMPFPYMPAMMAPNMAHNMTPQQQQAMWQQQMQNMQSMMMFQQQMMQMQQQASMGSPGTGMPNIGSMVGMSNPMMGAMAPNLMAPNLSMTPNSMTPNQSQMTPGGTTAATSNASGLSPNMMGTNSAMSPMSTMQSMMGIQVPPSHEASLKPQDNLSSEIGNDENDDDDVDPQAEEDPPHEVEIHSESV